MAIDKRKKYIIVLDTETCPMDTELQTVSPYNMLVYDLGFAVVDKAGNVYEKYSFVVSEVFFGEKDMMKSAYYAKKLPQYYEDIKSGKRKVASYWTIRKILRDTMKKYHTHTIAAHNARFDKGATDNTSRWIYKSKYRFFFPFGTEVWDTMKMAHDVVSSTPTYKRFCEENGYMTKHNRPQEKAEVLYKYISGNTDFVESHTGLEDVMIEKEIMAYCFRKHGKMRKKLYN